MFYIRRAELVCGVVLMCIVSAAIAAIIMLAAALPARATVPNVGDARAKAIAYHNSGAYMRELTKVDAAAFDYIRRRAKRVNKPALVLDIDETSLSNWAELAANGLIFRMPGPCDQLPKGPCGLVAWQQMAQADGIAPTVRLAAEAQKMGVTLFFLTGRHEAVREATAENLRRAGYANWKELILRPDGAETRSAADYKAPQRARIEAEGYTIIANIGDQPSDLAGGHAERTFLLPDPFYRIP